MLSFVVDAITHDPPHSAVVFDPSVDIIKGVLLIIRSRSESDENRV